jgi:hypothetical protein
MWDRQNIEIRDMWDRQNIEIRDMWDRQNIEITDMWDRQNRCQYSLLFITMLTLDWTR